MSTPTNQKSIRRILKHPRITEKGTNLSAGSVYTFDVGRGANKHEISAAIQTLYKVTPRAIRIVAVPRKSVSRKGRLGYTTPGKKAYITLKKGDKIEFV